MKRSAGLPSLLLLFASVCPAPLTLHAQVVRWTANGLPVCTASGWQKNPRAVSDGAGGVIVAWEDIRSGVTPAIYSARITRDGTTPWVKDGISVSDGAAGQQLAGLAADGAGGAYIAWWNRRSGTYDVSVQHINAAGTALWAENGAPVCGAAKDQQWAAIIADGEGGCIVAWQDTRDTGNDIHAQRLSPEGAPQWGADGTPVCIAAGEQLYPDLATDRHGGAYVVWMDRRSGDDIYAQHIASNGARTWSADLAVCALPERQIAPKIAPAGRDGAAVVWQDYRHGAAQSAIYMQLLAADGNGLFLDGYQLAESPKSQSGIFLTTDGRDGAMATWTDFRNGLSDGDVYFSQILSDGTIPKTSSQYGEPICTLAASAQEIAQLVGDSTGGAFVVWQDKRNTFDYDLYMNRISASGRTNYADWTQNGLLLATADHDQLSPQLVPAGRGSAIAVWTDGRVADGQADIYAQKVDFAPWLSTADTLDFRVVKVNETLIDTLVIGNIGSVPLKITDIRRPPVGNAFSDFRILTALTFPIMLETDSSLRIAVSFTPKESGDRNTQLRINSNSSIDPVIVPLTGFGAIPKIAVLQMFIFGASRVGAVIDTVVEDLIRSTGTGPLLVTGLSMAGDNPDDFLLPDGLALPFAVPAQGAVSLRLRFRPSGEGSRTALLKIMNSSSDSIKQTILRGAGGYPVFNNNPLRLRFDKTIVPATPRKLLDLLNTGGVDLNITAMRLDGGRADQFALDPFTPFVVPASGKTSIGITFKPTEAGSFATTLLVEADDLSSPHSIPVDGTAEVVNAADALPDAQSFRIEEVYPQPLQAGAQLRVTIALDRQATDIEIDLVDMLGRSVVRRSAGALSPGRHTLALDLGSDVTLSPGVYRLRVSAVSTLGSAAREARVLLLP